MNEQEIRKWYHIFKNDSELVEIRVVESRPRKRIWSGYFTDIESLLSGIRPFDHANVYFTLNAINEACKSKPQANRMLDGVTTTSGNDIIGRDWALIDIDVQRPTDTNSSDEELQMAKDVANHVYKFLRDQGFNLPVVCMSGNGVHLLLKMSMANTKENTEIMKNFLLVLDMFFSTDKVHIDTQTFDPNRICKLYGCYSRKGSNTPERPQRLSTIVRVPDEVKATPNEFFAKVAAMLPQQEKPSSFNGYSSERFDLDGFLREHGIEVDSRQRFSGGEKIVLKACPFNDAHRAPDAALFVMDSGAIGFKCLHASCSQYTFRDFRLHFDPNAYDRKDYESYRAKRDYYSRSEPRQVEIVAENKDIGRKWNTMNDIKFKDPREFTYIPMGIEKLDAKIMGLALGDVSVISGRSGSGKSSLLNFILLNMIQRGYHTAVWSGELQDFRFMSWLDQCAAGRNYVKKMERFENIYYAPQDVCKKINSWIGDKLLLYNNNYGNKWAQLFSDMKEAVTEKGVQVIVVDNLMALSLETYSGEKNEKQTQFITDLKSFAKQQNIHILLVCHPRKETGNQLLRMESISGTADLTNLCDNLFLVHRVGRDFEKRANEFFGREEVQDLLQYDTVVEVAKNRSNGVTDYLVGLYFEIESRRFMNYPAEYIVYGWQDPEPPSVIQDSIMPDLSFVEDMPEF